VATDYSERSLREMEAELRPVVGRDRPRVLGGTRPRCGSRARRCVSILRCKGTGPASPARHNLAHHAGRPLVAAERSEASEAALGPRGEVHVPFVASVTATRSVTSCRVFMGSALSLSHGSAITVDLGLVRRSE
jgi:hypothetical protein